MATFNLVRNTRVFFTTNVAAGTGIITTTGLSATAAAANTQELQVLDGFTFSQGTTADTITINEAGSTPTRGQRAFNTALNPVDFSFSTYIRPGKVGTVVTAEESVLWNALLSQNATATLGKSATTTSNTQAPAASFVPTTASCTATTGVLVLTATATNVTGMVVGEVYTFKGVVGVGASELNTPAKLTTITGATTAATVLTFTYLTPPSNGAATAAATLANWTTPGVKIMNCAWNEHVAVAADTVGPVVAYSSLNSGPSNKNTLLPFGLIVVVDNQMYLLDNCAMDQAVVDFGLDGIAMVAWTGKGTAIRTSAAPTISAAADPVFTGSLSGTSVGKYTGAGFITNKLSTITLTSGLSGTGAAGTAVTMALTGGSITIANNINYLTPANLGVLNTPIGYFTGTRSITGSVTAYLRSGSGNTGALLTTLLAAGVEPKYRLQVEIGGLASTTRVELLAEGASLQVPTVDTQAVMSTTINFTAEAISYDGVSALGYDLESTNELRLRYFSATTV